MYADHAQTQTTTCSSTASLKCLQFQFYSQVASLHSATAEYLDILISLLPLMPAVHVRKQREALKAWGNDGVRCVYFTSHNTQHTGITNSYRLYLTLTHACTHTHTPHRPCLWPPLGLRCVLHTCLAPLLCCPSFPIGALCSNPSLKTNSSLRTKSSRHSNARKNNCRSVNKSSPNKRSSSKCSEHNNAHSSSNSALCQRTLK